MYGAVPPFAVKRDGAVITAIAAYALIVAVVALNAVSG